MQSVIGIDIGTTNTKAIALSKQGEVLASANKGYSFVSSKEGHYEINPTDILNAVIFVLKKILFETKPKSEIRGISFSCAMHSLIVVGETNSPLTNIITWADLRSAKEASVLKNSEIGSKIYELTGTPIHSMNPLCKLIWLRKKRPDIFSKAKKFIGIKEYLWHEFFGKYQIDYSIASATGLFNIYSFKWNEESLKVAAIKSAQLSDIVDPKHTETHLSEKYKMEFGIGDNLPFIIGASDGCLANLGSNAIREGEASLTIGTSGALRMASPKPKHDHKKRIFNYILSKDIYISGGAMNNGGAVVQWYVNQFLKKPDTKEISFNDDMKMIDDVKAGSDGLIFLPYLFGERAPIWNADARAVFFGIKPIHQQKHFLRSIIEGISFSIYQIGISIEETVGPIKKIYASGGFTKSKTWLQIIADVFNKEVVVLNIADASAIGAAITGMQAVRLIDDFSEITNTFHESEKFLPNKQQHKIYQKNIEKFVSLYEKLKDEFNV